jgi:hypothetical protein
MASPRARRNAATGSSVPQVISSFIQKANLKSARHLPFITANAVKYGMWDEQIVTSPSENVLLPNASAGAECRGLVRRKWLK